MHVRRCHTIMETIKLRSFMFVELNLELELSNTYACNLLFRINLFKSILFCDRDIDFMKLTRKNITPKSCFLKPIFSRGERGAEPSLPEKYFDSV